MSVETCGQLDTGWLAATSADLFCCMNFANMKNFFAGGSEL